MLGFDRFLNKNNILNEILIVDCHYDVIKTEGFRLAYNIGRKEVDEIDYYFTYNYCYCIFFTNKIEIIKIFKL